MRRKNYGAKPLSLPQPVWIIATYDENGIPNAMNAAWGGISEENQLCICLTPSHKTCQNFARTGAFTVSMADLGHAAACDFVGMASGNDMPDKFARAGFTATRSPLVNAPIINELAVCIECRVIDFNTDTCILRGEIVNVSVDESALTDGELDMEKINPLCFDPFNKVYHIIGQEVGGAWEMGAGLMK